MKRVRDVSDSDGVSDSATGLCNTLVVSSASTSARSSIAKHLGLVDHEVHLGTVADLGTALDTFQPRAVVLAAPYVGE